MAPLDLKWRPCSDDISAGDVLLSLLDALGMIRKSLCRGRCLLYVKWYGLSYYCALLLLLLLHLGVWVGLCDCSCILCGFFISDYEILFPPIFTISFKKCGPRFCIINQPGDSWFIFLLFNDDWARNQLEESFLRTGGGGGERYLYLEYVSCLGLFFSVSVNDVIPHRHISS